MRKLLFVFVTSAALATLGGAQGFARMMSGPASEYMLLMRPDVQKDLKITDDEKAKMQTAQTDMFGQMRTAFQDNQGDQDAIQAAMKKLMDGLTTTIKGILTPEQLKRLHEINIQMKGASIATDPDAQKTLKLTDEQIKQVKGLEAKRDAANDSLMESVQNGDIDRSQIMDLRQKNEDALKTAIEKVLTDDQKAQLKKMGGAPFENDPNYKPQFRFGGAGGGGG